MLVQQEAIDALQSPESLQLDAFNLSVADFTDRWLGQDDDGLDTAVALFAGKDLEMMKKLFLGGNADIGVEAWSQYSMEDLHRSLGFENGLPATFREQFVEDGSKVVISWHQLTFIAALIAQYVDNNRAEVRDILYDGNPDNVKDALQALR